MSKIRQIQALVQNNCYYLTEHAMEEAEIDDFDVFDVEHGILTGKTHRTWPRDDKYEVVGMSLDGRLIGVVLRVTKTIKVRIITVYEYKPSL